MFMLFGAFNLCFIPFVYFYCPETAGVPLESIDTFYLPGVDPINESEKLRQEIRYARKGEKEVLAMEEAIIGEEPILDEEEKEHVGETGK